MTDTILVRRFCYVTNSFIPLSLSIVDYRNNYLLSSNVNKIIEFYDGFDDKDELIRWFKEKPRGFINTYEIKGPKDVIVVIPTSNFYGQEARVSREKIFKGLHIIFVESGEPQDPYFNYANSCNVGIEIAMKYNPSWIIISKDNMEIVDNTEKLTKEIKEAELNNSESEYLLAQPLFDYISRNAMIVKPRITRAIINYFLPKGNSIKIGSNILKKFNIKYIPRYTYSFKDRFLYRFLFNYNCYISFGIFKKSFFLRSFKEFGSYIPFGEDDQLSIFASSSKTKTSYVNYKIKPTAGKVLGTGDARYLRGIIFSRIIMADYLVELLNPTIQHK